MANKFIVYKPLDRNNIAIISVHPYSGDADYENLTYQRAENGAQASYDIEKDKEVAIAHIHDDYITPWFSRPKCFTEEYINNERKRYQTSLEAHIQNNQQGGRTQKDKVKHKGRYYTVRTGPQGGRYILVGEQKKYLHH